MTTSKPSLSPHGGEGSSQDHAQGEQRQAESEGQSLLPCPFCGGEVISAHEGRTKIWHECISCGAETAGEHGHQEARDAWNRRAAIVPVLSADFARSLPGGKLDDSSYEAIEDALDRADAPMTSADGRWLSLAERVAALSSAKQVAVEVPGRTKKARRLQSRSHRASVCKPEP